MINLKTLFKALKLFFLNMLARSNPIRLARRRKLNKSAANENIAAIMTGSTTPLGVTSPTDDSLPLGAIGTGAIKIVSMHSEPMQHIAPPVPHLTEKEIQEAERKIDQAENMVLEQLSREKVNPDSIFDQTRKIEEMPPRILEDTVDLSLPSDVDDENPLSHTTTPLTPVPGQESSDTHHMSLAAIHSLTQLRERQQLSEQFAHHRTTSPTSEGAISPPVQSPSDDEPRLHASLSMSSIASGIQDHINNNTVTQILMEQMQRIEQLQEQVQLLTLQNRELVHHVSYLMSQDQQRQNSELDIHRVAEILEDQYEINRKVRTVALVNTTSGSGRQYGDMLLKRFGSLLGSENVFEMSKGPKEILEALMRESKTELRVIVAGGDGSVNWVLNSLNQLQEKWEQEQKTHGDSSVNSALLSMLHRDPPKIAVFPLGVGNDLSRILRWGGGFNALTDSITLYTKRVAEAQVVKLDRWKIVFKSESKIVTYLCSNYFSLGVDAQIALNFHVLRKENPQLCLNRTTNKLWYLSAGIGELLKSSEQLGKSVKVTADSRRVGEKRAQSFIWVNIPSYSGGTNLWLGAKQAAEGMQPQAIDDGNIECVALTGVNHIAQIKAGLQPAIPVAQGRSWKIVFTPTPRRPTLAAQVDGEPFLLEEATEITIERHKQVDVLAGESPSLLDILSHVPIFDNKT